MATIEDRIENFFVLATLYDSEKDCLKPKATSHGIDTLQKWKEQMDTDLDWLHENSLYVLINLANLRKKWPACCEALEEILI